MIPILYEKGETQFRSNGICRLAECLSCDVTEKRNDIYELVLTYPVTGRHYADIIAGIEDNTGDYGRIIYVTHDSTKQPQPFDLYKHTAPLNGIVTFYARHVSYRLTKQVLKPFTAFDAGTAFSRIAQNVIGGTEFTFWTDKTTLARLNFTEPRTVRQQLGGVTGSMLDVYNGGDYQFDHFNVRLYGHLGADTGVQIRYGKNLTDLTHNYDVSECYNAIAPYWTNSETGETVMLPNGIVSMASELGQEQRAVPMDFSDQFDTQPTTQQLTATATAYLRNNQPWIPNENLTIKFEQDLETLQSIKLLDTVDVIYPKLGLNAVKKRVIKYVYDSLRDKYTSLELGEPMKSFSAAIADSVEGKVLTVVPTRQEVQAQMDAATRQITGFKDSHIRFLYDSDGGLQEIVILDTEDIETAQNVWRMNSGGFGHSSNGYDGPYTLAMTQDGAIVADAIKTGLLTDAQGKSCWNMLTGVMNIVGTFSSESTTQSGTYRMKVENGAVVFQRKSGNNWQDIAQMQWGNFQYEDEGSSTHTVSNLLNIYGANGLRLYSNKGGIVISKDYGILIDTSASILIGEENSGLYSKAYTGEIKWIETVDDPSSGLTIDYEHTVYVDNGFVVEADKVPV